MDEEPISDAEEKLRERLWPVRWVGAYLPLSWANKLIDWSTTRANLPDDIIRKKVKAGGVDCEWLIPENYDGKNTLIYIHGGGFVFGLTSQHLEMVSYLVRQMQCRALVVDYRLAPDYPFPAALDDCIAAYQWLLDQGVSAGQITVAGDSAGGNLTITSLMRLRDEGVPLPAAAACLSPVGDLAKKDLDELEITDDLIIHPRAAKRFHISYVANSDPTYPLISPLYGTWEDLPPILIHAGEDEMLKDDAIRIKQAASTANTEVELKIYPRMWHVWQIYPELPQTEDSLDRIAAFLTSHLQQ